MINAEMVRKALRGVKDPELNLNIIDIGLVYDITVSDEGDVHVNMRDRPESTPLLKELAGIPTLVVVGAEDQVTTPDSAKIIADGIPGARLAIVSGAGHLTPLERAAEATALVVGFLRSLSPEASHPRPCLSIEKTGTSTSGSWIPPIGEAGGGVVGTTLDAGAASRCPSPGK